MDEKVTSYHQKIMRNNEQKVTSNEQKVTSNEQKVTRKKPNRPKNICKMYNNSIVKTARYLEEIFSSCIKDRFFANLKNV